MSASAALAPASRIARETTADGPGVEALVMAAFGPGRFAKTAERLRETATVAAGFVAWDGDRLVGSVRLWSIRVSDLDALFLGPIAVAEDARKGGLGADLVAACVEEARVRGVAGILLVGDPPYFSRFGFVAAPGVRLPGPVDPRRVLWLAVGSVAPKGEASAA